MGISYSFHLEFASFKRHIRSKLQCHDVGTMLCHGFKISLIPTQIRVKMRRKSSFRFSLLQCDSTYGAHLDKSTVLFLIFSATVYVYKTYLLFSDYLSDTKKKFSQPYTFVNYFPGYLVGRQMLDKKVKLVKKPKF